MSFLTLRLIPTQPRLGSDFAKDLKGLIVTAYDLSVQNNLIEDAVVLGSAKYDPDVAVTSIYQDSAPTSVQPPQPPQTTSASKPPTGANVIDYHSVATAVIETKTNSTYLEYQSFDVRFELSRDGQVIGETAIEYNANIFPGPPIALTSLTMEPSAYYQLSPVQVASTSSASEQSSGQAPISPTAASQPAPSINLNPNGQPPPFESLRQAINLVLKSDHPIATNTNLANDSLESLSSPLTAGQSLQIASELTWNRVLKPAPSSNVVVNSDASVIALDDMYTLAAGSSSKSIDTARDQARQKFESDLAIYRSTMTADAKKLATFVFSASAAIFCEKKSASASLATLTFPVKVDDPEKAKVKSADATIGLSSSDALLIVPAAYFYALSAAFPSQYGVQQRYTVATATSEAELLLSLENALNQGVFGRVVTAVSSAGTTININQAARRLVALRSTSGLANVPKGSVPQLLPGWLDYKLSSADIDDVYWDKAIASYPEEYVTLLLLVITFGAAASVTRIKSDLGVKSVGELVQLTVTKWTDFFQSQASLLPPFTSPGNTQQRINVFIARLRKFFALDAAQPPPPYPIPTFKAIRGDPFLQFIEQYNAISPNGAFSLGAAPDNESMEKALGAIFPKKKKYRLWLKTRLEILLALWQMTSITSTNLSSSLSPALQFSLMEALYARGITSFESIAELATEQVRSALVGTVAYQYAKEIQQKALEFSSGVPTNVVSDAGFMPVNADNCLVNYVPPPNVSQFGQIAYLSSCLAVSFRGLTLEQYISKRRGPVGNLHSTLENLQIPIPTIDLVNESLEALGSTLVGGGAVYDTEGDTEVLAAIPAYSTPTQHPAVYDALKSSFATPSFPYAQDLDICRSYLEGAETSRFEVMRLFRSKITELAPDATLEPSDFQSHLWRYPVRLEIALEYLHISKDEYSMLYQETVSNEVVLKAMGYNTDDLSRNDFTVFGFLKMTGLSYCEFYRLWQCQYVEFGCESIDGSTKQTGFPECNNYNLRKLRIALGVKDDSTFVQVRKLLVFVRLWRQLGRMPGSRMSFDQLADICNILGLFLDNKVNSDFIRQLAALLMMRDQCNVPLISLPTNVDHVQSPAQRTPLLALWAALPVTSMEWSGAFDIFFGSLQEYAIASYGCKPRSNHFKQELADNLGIFAKLCGFTDVDTWYAKPTNTIRFFEVLAKIYASRFTLGEISFLFSNDGHISGDDPYRMCDGPETFYDPLSVPRDTPFDLWSLRRKLQIDINEADLGSWTWPRIQEAVAELGYCSKTSNYSLRSLAEHFFPFVTEKTATNNQSSRYQVGLSSVNTTPCTWNADRSSPFRYDTATESLWIQLPLTDEAVIDKLRTTRQLNDYEIETVQNLYFAPRAALAPFAIIFEDFRQAAETLVQEPDEMERFRFFQRSVAIFYRRCEIIADHIVEHVVSVTGREFPNGREIVWKVLRTLLADENKPITDSWEMDSGVAPRTYTWDPSFSGSAFGTILGLTGTGLLEEFRVKDNVIWRNITSDMTFFGKTLNSANSPVPTLIPSPKLAVTKELKGTIVNGFARHEIGSDPLIGAQSFCVNWSGILLIEKGGIYTFYVGRPRPDNEEPDSEGAKNSRWDFTLRNGQIVTTVLSNSPELSRNVPAAAPAALHLDRGAYSIKLQFEEVQGTIRRHCRRPMENGFQLKYKGPDTEDSITSIPRKSLFRDMKNEPLNQGITSCETALNFLGQHFTSTLRDIRRTYQRAFKSALVVHQFNLSGEVRPEQDCCNICHTSELEYLLDPTSNFFGTSYFRTGSNTPFQSHHVDFNFNFLPVSDPYRAPSVSADTRAQVTLKRQAALFDWWERIYDFTRLRGLIKQGHQHTLWRLFYETKMQQSFLPDEFLLHLDIDPRLSPLLLTYFISPKSSEKLTNSSLLDERWAWRLWNAGIWVQRMKQIFHTAELEKVAPYLWASDEPNIAIDGTSGNQNIMSLFKESGSENPSDYGLIKRINDGLRQRGRDALLAYLTSGNQIALPFRNTMNYAQAPRDITDLLLQKTEVDTSQYSTRIGDALSAIQTFVQRGRLGLEIDFVPTEEFLQMWDTEYATFNTWQSAKRRKVYPENWIAWEELEKAKNSEGFRLLESHLRQHTLTIPQSGGLVWWADTSNFDELEELQSQKLASLQSFESVEGFDLMGKSALAGHQSLLSRIPPSASQSTTDTTNGAKLTQSSMDLDAIDENEDLPLWINSAATLGIEFVRVAAARTPAPLQFLRDDRSRGPSCADCGRTHRPTIDEYYFWLAGSHFFDLNGLVQDIQQGATPPSPKCDWDHPSEELLRWDPEHTIHLYWSRIHCGKFDSPRRSEKGHIIASATAAALNFLGRTLDSLTFTIADKATADSASQGQGFRYDMVQDSAEPVVLPLSVPTIQGLPPPLNSYPFFIYFEPGAPVFPLSRFSTAITVARTLRSHGKFERSLRWYERAFNPIERDNRWVEGVVSPDMARNRAVLLEYLESLLQWGDALLSRNENPATQQALEAFEVVERILGNPPDTVTEDLVTSVPTVISKFKASTFESALNPRLLSLYDRVADRRALAQSSLQSQVDNEFAVDGCELHQSLQPLSKPHPYRFAALLPIALELVTMVRTFGEALLQALEKADAEALVALQATYSRQISTLALEARKNDVRKCDWEKQALEFTLSGALYRYRYYQDLITAGYNAGEIGYFATKVLSGASATAASVFEHLAAPVQQFPDAYTGVVGVFPVTIAMTPGSGSKNGATFSALAKASGHLSTASGTAADVAQTEGGLQRRSHEWKRDLDLVAKELQQIECQKLAADQQRAIATRELNNTILEIEQAIEVQDFLRDKFSTTDLYFFLQQEIATLFRQSYDLALQTASDTQRLFWYEYPDKKQNFLPPFLWNNFRESLLAGQQLELSLRSMENAAMVSDTRGFDITKNISLRKQLPVAFLQLATTGFCEIELPEWMFDLDYPGHYMRRISHLRLTISCDGPLPVSVGINCRLFQLSSSVRIEPTLTHKGYERQFPHDRRFINNYAATESIATSNGNQDSGTFSIVFTDTRYFPFELTGAVSRWRLELPPENNQFDISTLSDVVMHLSYTASDGGDKLRIAANQSAQRQLSIGGSILLDARRDFPNAWKDFHLGKAPDATPFHDFPVQLSRSMFPYMSGNSDVCVTSIQLLFTTQSLMEKHIKVKFCLAPHTFGDEKDDCCNAHIQKFDCHVVYGKPWQYSGVLPIQITPEAMLKDVGTIRFPGYVSTISDIQFLCCYEPCNRNKWVQSADNCNCRSRS